MATLLETTTTTNCISTTKTLTTDAGTAPVLRSSTKEPPTQDPKVLVRRFLERRQFLHHGKGKHIFNPDTFKRKADEHIVKYAISTHGENARNRNGGFGQRIVFKEVATFGDVFFFQNPRDAKDLHSVRDEKMRQVMLARGYVEVYPTRAQGI